MQHTEIGPERRVLRAHDVADGPVHHLDRVVGDVLEVARDEGRVREALEIRGRQGLDHLLLPEQPDDPIVVVDDGKIGELLHRQAAGALPQRIAAVKGPNPATEIAAKVLVHGGSRLAAEAGSPRASARC
jgi:hypothetical protein